MLIRIGTTTIHRATVAEANLSHVGSITIDRDVVAASGARPFQMANITNLSNGALLETYVMQGEAGARTICLTGPPARRFQPGDKVIIVAEAYADPAELGDLDRVVAFLDDRKRVTKVERDDSLGPGVRWRSKPDRSDGRLLMNQTGARR